MTSYGRSPYASPERYIPPEKIKKAKGTRNYTNIAQCSARYHKGNRAGQRCGWYARPGSIYCKKHGTMEGHVNSPEHDAAVKAGARNWWARMWAIEAQRPGFMKELRRSVSENYKLRWQRQREAGCTAPRLMAPEIVLGLPTPEVDDKKVMKAHREVARDLLMLPKDPDKPFEDMSDSEQFVVLRRKSLSRAHEVLCLPIRDEDGMIMPKMVTIIKDAAIRTLALGVKVDQTALAERRMDKVADLLLRLKGEPLALVETLPPKAPTG